MTAAHVLKTAEEHDEMALGYYNGTSYEFMKIPQVELFEDIDIGVIESSIPNGKSLKWNSKQLEMSVDVEAIGFPFSLDLENKRIIIRDLKGHIVSAGNIHFEFKGKPTIYELSFNCPRGISGTALLTFAKEPEIKGVVIQSRMVEIETYRVKEIIGDGNKEKTFEKYETTYFGVAIEAASILKMSSKILGGTIEEHLIKHKLLVTN